MVDQIKLKVTVLLPSTNAVWGNVMFYTCQSLCSRGGGSTPLHAGIHTHPGQTSPRQTSPWAADTSEADTQLGRHTHLPWADTPPADTTTTHPLPPTPSPILRNTVKATGTHLLERILLVGILLFSLSLALDEIVTISVRKTSPGAMSSSLTRCPSDLGNILAVL